jgi:hypothetical protein
VGFLLSLKLLTPALNFFDTIRNSSRKQKAITLATGLVALVYIAIEAQDRDDFWIYISGSRDLFLGKNIYTEIYNEWYHYLYSVFFAILLYPLTLLPFYVAKLLWLALNLFFTWRIFAILFSCFNRQEAGTRAWKWFTLLSVLFCVRFINDNFHYGQVTLLLLYLCLQGADLIFRGRDLPGTALVALGINIKLMPLVLLPYFLYRGKLRASAWIAGLTVCMFILPSAVIGHGRNMFLLDTWWSMMNPGNTEHILDTYDRGFHGLSTLFAVYLHDVTPDPNGYGTRINIMNLDVERLNLLLNGVRLLLIGLTLFFLRARPFRVPGKKERLFEMSYVLALVPLIFPHQQFYAFVFQLPAVMCILSHLFTASLSPAARAGWSIALGLVFLCFNLQLLLGEFTPFYEHFKLVTFGGLAVLVLLWLTRRAFPWHEKI